MTTLNEQVLAEVRGDLAAFADTHSRLEFAPPRAVWTRQGASYEAAFVQRPGAGYPDVQLNGARKPYVDFLASEAMANLTALAESIYFACDVDKEKYVEPRTRIEGSEDGDQNAETVLENLVEDVPLGATRVVLLRGAAGAGKTVALRHLAQRQADLYLNRDAGFLYLYIDAQARYLARLDDAVALVLQDLNARFTYRALSTLTRHGLVVPIIDGFDELIGAGAGGEAIDALTQFLARLDGRGVTIASARSTYFDFSRIRTSADRFGAGGASFAIVPAELQEWTEREMCAYLGKNDQYRTLGANSAAEALRTLEETFCGDGGSGLLSTPFFLAAAVEVAREPSAAAGGARPIRRIIDSFVRREVGKLLNTGDEPILSEEGHRRFLGMLAEEMWRQERRELDGTSVEIIAELLAEEVGMSDGDLRAFVAHVSSYAFLTTGRAANGPRMLAFTHEYYYAFFVARLLAEELVDGEDVTGLLGHSRISPTIAAEFAEHVNEEGAEFVASVLRSLSTRRVPVPTRETNRANAGALYAALAGRRGPIDGLHLYDASFTGADFRDTVQRNVRVENCDFVDPDFRGADWTFQATRGSTFSRLAVDAGRTRLEGLRVEIGADLVGLRDGGGRTEYSPGKMAAICRKIGIPVPDDDLPPPPPPLSELAEATIELLHKLLHVSERMYYLSGDILTQRGISSHGCWPDLERRLLEHGLLEEKKTQKSGPEGSLRRLAFPPGIIAEGEGRAANPAIREFWRAIRAL